LGHPAKSKQDFQKTLACSSAEIETDNMVQSIENDNCGLGNILICWSVKPNKHLADLLEQQSRKAPQKRES